MVLLDLFLGESAVHQILPLCALGLFHNLSLYCLEGPHTYISLLFLQIQKGDAPKGPRPGGSADHRYKNIDTGGVRLDDRRQQGAVQCDYAHRTTTSSGAGHSALRSVSASMSGS